MSARVPGFDLLLVTDPDAGGDLVEAVGRALEGAPAGRVAVVLRARAWPARALFEAAAHLRERTAACGAALFVNDRADVARAVGADGVQLPEAGLPVAAARAALPPGARVGVSRHDAAGLATAGGADFVLLAPVFAVPGKGPPLGAAGLAGLVARSPAPVVALGGIVPSTAGVAIAAGAAAIAVQRAVFRATAPGDTVRALLSAVDAARGAAR